MAQTATEKILESTSDASDVTAGDTVEASIDVSWVHETQFSIFKDLFEDFGGEVWDREKAIFMVDHTPNPTDESQAQQVRAVEEYADDKDMDVVTTGIKHQAWRSLGVARPGAVMAGPDSHTPTAGAMGAFATCLGPTDTAIVWNEGEIWLDVPGTLRFTIRGDLGEYVTPRDIGFSIFEQFGDETAFFADNNAIEYTGETVEQIGLDGRQTLCNMAADMGAMSTYIEPDNRLEHEYLDSKVDDDYEVYQTDDDAEFVGDYEVTVDSLEPKVAYPHSPNNVHDIEEASGIDIDQCFIGSCANGMLEDLRIAASVLEGREIHPDIDLIVTPASDEIRKQASAEGTLDTFQQAGARVTSNYCSVCVGYEGVLLEGERCLSTSTRNYKGRMGHPDSEIYLGSPAVVAASAVEGEIADPREL
ncbi:MAG: aconitase/3-isopropylmalate dehydratase large subunit family protein [Halapricum sp.]